jgi:chloramphenicol O-acetyltransferase type A
MAYEIVNMEKYYRKDIFRRFSVDCKCSVSITSRIDVGCLFLYSKETDTKFYINFLYILAKVLNSKKDYRLGYLKKSNQVVIYDKINPAHYVFHEKNNICTPVYTEFLPEYTAFYRQCLIDIQTAKQKNSYEVDDERHPNWFDASYLSWISYDAMHVELPDGYLHFMPIINWGRYRDESGKFLMPVTVRMNHAVADGYLVSQVFVSLQKEINDVKNSL